MYPQGQLVGSCYDMGRAEWRVASGRIGRETIGMEFGSNSHKTERFLKDMAELV